MRRSRPRRWQRGPQRFLPSRVKKRVIVRLPRLSLSLIGLLSLLSVILIFHSDLFLVHEVLVQASPTEAVVSLTATEMKLAGDLVRSRSLNRSIFFVDSDKIVKEIMANFMTLKKASLKKNYPNRLLLDLVPRIPVAEIDVWPASAAARLLPNEFEPDLNSTSFSPNRKLVSDQEGFLFAQVASSSGMPVINIFHDGKVEVGDRLEDQSIRQAIAIIEELKLWQHEVVEIGLVGKEAIPVRLKDQVLVIFSSSKDVQKQVASLQAVISRPKMKKRKPSRIDLRFNHPVVKYRTSDQ